jgi:hypothetical protein
VASAPKGDLAAKKRWSECVVDQDEDMHDVCDEEGREVGEDGAPPAGVQQVPRRKDWGCWAAARAAGPGSRNALHSTGQG